jgi:hemerythrin-like domain-containing protein
VDARDLSGFAQAFSDFAEHIHHEKEESILLPLLVHHGFEWESGVLADVRGEHRHEQYLVDVLSQVGERAGSWSNEDRRQISAAAMALVEFQRNHHHRENNELFPEVLVRLSVDALRQLQTQLEKFDEDPHHQKFRAAALGVAWELIERYPAESSPAPQAAREDQAPSTCRASDQPGDACVELERNR